ncbi:hypothetical protein ABFX02_06G137700 [Erythranthe guttata]
MSSKIFLSLDVLFFETQFPYANSFSHLHNQPLSNLEWDTVSIKKPNTSNQISNLSESNDITPPIPLQNVIQSTSPGHTRQDRSSAPQPVAPPVPGITHTQLPLSSQTLTAPPVQVQPNTHIPSSSSHHPTNSNIPTISQTHVHQ